MQLSSGTQIPDGLLAAMTLLNEKPCLGVPSKNPAPNQGIDERNSTAAIGMRLGLALEAARQSERARYFGSETGRFMSPDWADKAEPVPYAKLADPQTLNLYAYAGNNPMSNRDADGHLYGDASGSPSLPDECPDPEACGHNPAIRTFDQISNENWARESATADQNGQQQIGQDPTLPTAVAPPPPSWFDRFMNAILPKTWGDFISLALMIPTDGLAEVPAAAGKAIGITSSIGEDAKLVKYAEEAGKSVQQGLDSLVKELAKGNTNPGLGTKSLGKGISYARARDGARVFFRQSGNQIEILAKASKANETAVINYLKTITK